MSLNTSILFKGLRSSVNKNKSLLLAVGGISFIYDTYIYALAHLGGQRYYVFWLSVHPSVRQSIGPSICVSVCLSVCYKVLSGLSSEPVGHGSKVKVTQD